MLCSPPILCHHECLDYAHSLSLHFKMGWIALWRCGFAFHVCKSRRKWLSWSGCFSILTWKQINLINRKLLCPPCRYSRKHPGFSKQRCVFIIGKLGKKKSWSQYLGFVAEQTGRKRDSKLIILILSFRFRNNIEQSKA